MAKEINGGVNLQDLIKSGKVVIDKDGCVIWIWNPELIKKLEREGLIIR